MSGWTLLPRPDERRDVLGEGITWVPAEAALYWVDIIGRQVHRHDLASGAGASWTMPEMIGWLVPRTTRPGFIAGLKSGIHALTLDPVALDLIVSPEPDLPFNRLNDCAVDRHGAIWAGTMSMDGSRADGALYRLDPDLSLHRMDAPYRIANGPAIAPDGTAMYHADSAAGVVWRLPVHDDGSLGPRSVFVEFPGEWGSPDGMTVDAAGGVWIAHWGGGCVSRFDPAGRRELWIDLPASQITRPCFAGEGLDRMFVTSAADGVDEPLAGSVFEVDPGVAGCPPFGFAG